MEHRNKTLDSVADTSSTSTPDLGLIDPAALRFCLTSGLITDANERMFRLLGRTAASLIGRSLAEIFPDKEKDDAFQRITALRPGSDVQFKAMVRNDTGSARIYVSLHYEEHHPDLVRVILSQWTTEAVLSINEHIINDLADHFQKEQADADSSYMVAPLIAKYLDGLFVCICLKNEGEDTVNIKSAFMKEHAMQFDDILKVPMHVTFTAIVMKLKKRKVFADLQSNPAYKDFTIVAAGAESVLAVPLIAAGTIHGCLIIGSTDPHTILHELINVMTTAANILTLEHIRKETEQHLVRHRNILDAVNGTAEILLKSGLDQNSVHCVLQKLGMTTECSGIFIFENTCDQDGEQRMTERYFWFRAPGPSLHIPLSHVSITRYLGSKLKAELAAGRTLVVQTTELPASTQRLLRKINIRSFIITPIIVEGSWWGTIAFDFSQNNASMRPLERAALRTAADLFASLIQRQKRDTHLQLSEERFRVMFNGSVDVIMVVDADTGKMLQVNDASMRILGYDPQQLINQSFSTLLKKHDHDRSGYLPIDYAEQNTVTMRFTQRFDGVFIPMDITASLIPWGQKKAVLLTLRDVTEREEVQEIVRQNEERYRHMFEDSPVAIIELDLCRLCEYTERIHRLGVADFTDFLAQKPNETQWCLNLLRAIDINRSALALFGYRGKIDALQHIADIFKNEQTNRLAKVIEMITRRQTSMSGEGRYQNNDGKALYLLERWFVQPHTEKKYSRVLVTFVDITQQRIAEQEAHIRSEQLMQADRQVMLGNLVAGVAHEINNPNSFVTMNTPIVKEAWNAIIPLLDQHLADHGDFNMGYGSYVEMRDEINILLDDIYNGAVRIKNIIKELNTLSRSSPSDLFAPVNVNDIVRTALTLMKNTIKRATAYHSASFAEDLPKINGHVQRLDQAILNIITNSCQALTHRDQTLDVATYFDPLRNEVVLRIADGGMGIRPEDIPRLFDPFYTTKRNSGGTGLGLPIALGIIQEHGGTMHVESIVNEGTTTEIRLPSITKHSKLNL